MSVAVEAVELVVPIVCHRTPTEYQREKWTRVKIYPYLTNPHSFINSINSAAVDVLVSHVVTPSEFYVQYKKDKQLLNALNDQVQKHCTCTKLEAKLEPGITNV